jgi:tetratricopeptide (TPR) repeat protein
VKPEHAAGICGERSRPEKLYLKALRLKEHLYGENAETGLTLNNLALFYKQRGRLNEANDAYQRALNCYQRTLGPSDSAVATILENLASLWRTMAEAADQQPPGFKIPGND